MNSDPRFAYRENTARSASPLGRVVLLYEQAIKDLGAAMAALASGDIERRTQNLNHALLVIGQLQACLDLDRGGDVARNLDRFYGLLQKRLLEAQVRGSAEILREQIDLLLSIRAAWVEVENSNAGAVESAENRGAETTRATSGMNGESSHWRA
jgi:flagellar secretion chaperone FliS